MKEKIKKFLTTRLTLDNLIQVSIVIFSVSSGFFIAYKNKWGYILGLLSQIPWWAFAIRKRQFGIIITNIFYTTINCIGFYNWFFK